MVARLFRSFCDRLQLNSKVAGYPFQLQPDVGGPGSGAAPLHNTHRAGCLPTASCCPHKQEHNNPFSPADLDLADYFDTPVETTTKPAKPTPKPFPKPGKPGNAELPRGLSMPRAPRGRGVPSIS